MYARDVEDQTLTFFVSGKLWGDSLVMADRETDSLWSHILGTAMAGPLKGTRLRVIPSVIETWKEWKGKHPSTTVTAFPRSALGYEGRVLQSTQDYVVGLRQGRAVVAYTLTALAEENAVNDTVDGTPVVVFYEPLGHGATVFRRGIDGKSLEFTFEDGRFRAGESTWNPTTGEAIDGPLQGQRLEALPSILSFADRWLAFHPKGRVYGKIAVRP